MGFTLFAAGALAPGTSDFWFCNKKSLNQVRTYTAVPIWYGFKVSVNGEVVEFGPAVDQEVTVGEVYHVLFGAAHPPADQKNLQVNVEVRNHRSDAWCQYELYEWES